MMEITVYTDGSRIPGQDKRGYAGIGIWFGDKDNKNESRFLDGENITHQYAELKAIEIAIKYCRYIPSVKIITDSEYSMLCITKWGDSWERNSWITVKGTPVLNEETIKSTRQFISLRSQQGMKTSIAHTKAHKGTLGNEGADKLARGAAERLENLYMSDVHYFDSGRLSNFFFSDIDTDYNGVSHKFNCVEQFYQYHKAIHFEDQDTASSILSSPSQFMQRSLGQKVKGFDQSVWDKVKYQVMMYGVKEKFKQHRDLREYLTSITCSTIVEARPDSEWGIGISKSDAMKRKKWNGKNLLGKVLMTVRQELFEQF